MLFMLGASGPGIRL